MLLIVEHSDRFRAKLKEHLEINGLQNFYVESTKDALFQLQSIKAKFLLVDLNAVTAISELDELREYSQQREVPLLLISGHQNTQALEKRLQEKGYLQFMRLPFRVSELKARVEQMRKNADPFIGAMLGPPGQGIEILRKLGSGAMGSVYEAHHEALDRRVAVKFLSESLQDDTFGTAARFFKEAKAMAKLRSAYIAQIYFAGNHAGRAYMVMEYIEGPNLDKYLAAKGKLKVREALAVCRDVLVGLSHAHKHGQIHRDIKPANIMLNPDGQAILLDFGLVRSLTEESMTQAGTVLGTPRYISPEQVRGSQVDHRSDLYSLGVIMFELIVGKPPFKGKDFYAVLVKHLNEPMPHPEKFGVFMHPAVWEIVEKLCRKHQDARFQNAEKVIEAIDSVLSQVDPADLEQAFGDTETLVQQREEGWTGVAINRTGSAIAKFGKVPPQREHMLASLNGLIQTMQSIDVFGDFERGNCHIKDEQLVVFPFNEGLAYIGAPESQAHDYLEQFTVADLAQYFEVGSGR